MSEKRIYQEKMLNSEKEIVVCNWERGEGKTYSIFRKIMENKNGKYLYVSPFSGRTLQDYFKELCLAETENIKNFSNSKEFTKIEYKNGDKLEVYYSLFNSDNNNIIGKRNIGMAFYDECYPNKDTINKILKPIDVNQIFIMMTNDNIEYINSRKAFDCQGFFKQQIEELMMEYSNLSKTQNTTMTRENILKQIKALQDMARGN